MNNYMAIAVGLSLTCWFSSHAFAELGWTERMYDTKYERLNGSDSGRTSTSVSRPTTGLSGTRRLGEMQHPTRYRVPYDGVTYLEAQFATGFSTKETWCINNYASLERVVQLIREQNSLGKMKWEQLAPIPSSALETEYASETTETVKINPDGSRTTVRSHRSQTQGRDNSVQIACFRRTDGAEIVVIRDYKSTRIGSTRVVLRAKGVQ